ncbi:macrolide family glycosyltransferase [Bacillus pseudomycoides]|uniref:macrolide family glycosyltransferase n=1 Tax=Bacillus pseudomycoides TaxID=64104 RepID=UPI000BED42F8|nr:macrolide family glycosyltransferase [Bacillus pseudomycoides]PED05551.1 UDP-glucosyltransferase [Bacillus pseudomycoides]PEI87469.1 UDP-glucosyltransferase [Bacillus pseudomycoides]PEK14492.1 UDP-glucosyltransferase [Bacillus pseudomycoides]PEM63831.1 UDP-glucosyltransferase [Bacillus pseudomycoides]PEO09653.1 UDP-glucosyltransferase [Bacillus pseudomycoides]
MANILMINFPAEGHVNPTLGIVKAFAERGDSVHYITTEKFKERLEKVGATVHLQPDLLSKASIDRYSNAGLNAFLKIQIQTSLDALDITKQLSQDIDFDFVFYEKFGAGQLVRDYLQIPGICSSASFLFPKEFLKNMPLSPESGFKPDEEAEKLMVQMKECYGVEPESSAQFMNNAAELTIVFTSRYFQPNSEKFDDSNIFIGPTFPKRAYTGSFPFEALEDEQVLYISMGTVLDRTEEFFNTCIDAFSDFKGKVVIAAGERVDMTKIKEAPEHFIISSYVPQLKVLEHTDVFITHGGMNSVNESIHFNIPMVVIPHDKDQPTVAQRLTELNAGYRVSKDNLKPETLKDAVKEVLTNEIYKEGIKKINESFQKSGGAEKAIEAIDAFVQNKK